MIKCAEFKQNDRLVILGFALIQNKITISSHKDRIYKNIHYDSHQLAMLVLRISHEWWKGIYHQRDVKQRW